MGRSYLGILKLIINFLRVFFCTLKVGSVLLRVFYGLYYGCCYFSHLFQVLRKLLFLVSHRYDQLKPIEIHILFSSASFLFNSFNVGSYFCIRTEWTRFRTCSRYMCILTTICGQLQI